METIDSRDGRSEEKEVEEESFISFRFPIIVGVLSLLGGIVSFYTLYNHFKLNSGSIVSTCDLSATFNCTAVETSQWAKIFGIPLGAYGVAFFTFIMLATVVLKRKKLLPLVLFFSLFSSLSSVALFAIAKLAVGVICPVCLLVYVINFTLLSIAIYHSRSSRKRMGSVKYLIISFTDLIRSNWIEIFLLSTISGIALAVSLPLAEEMGSKETAYQSELVSKKVADDTIFQEWAAKSETNIPLNFNGAPSSDFLIGSSKARVQVVEFIDFLCPACQSSFFKLLALQDKYPDKFSLVVKNYPLDSECNSSVPDGGHEGSCKIAALVRCLGEQNRFREAAEIAFAGGLALTSNNNFIDGALSILEKNIDFDLAKAKECYNSGRQQEIVKGDIKIGDTIPVEHTPTIFLNKREIGAELNVNIERLIDLVDKSLAAN
jgi:protein-disulfide isomerase/uncharacterized membrane protein